MYLTKIQSVYSQIRNNFQEQQLKKLPILTGEYSFVLIYAYTIDSEKYQELISSLLTKNLFAIFVSTKLPKYTIKNKNLIHVLVSPRYMGMTTFTRESFNKISMVMGLDLPGNVEAARVSMHFNIPLVLIDRISAKRKLIKIKNLESNFNILFDTNYQASRRGLGDILISTAIIKQIREDNPNAYITYSTRPEAKFLLKDNPNIDELITEPYIKHKFEDNLDNYDKHYFLGRMTEDYLIERNRQPRVDSMAELFDLTLKTKTPEIFLTKLQLKSGERFIDKEKLNIVFSIEASSVRRKIKTKLLLKLLNNLKPQNYNLIVVGTKKINLPKWVNNLTGKTTMEELFSVIHLSDLVVTMDNFVSHISATLNKKAIVLYTTIPNQWRCKYYKNVIPIQSKIECSPCWNCFKFEDRTCKNKEKCVDAFDMDEIAKKIISIETTKITSVENLFEDAEEKLVVKPNLKTKTILVKMPAGELGDKLVVLGLITKLKKIYKNSTIDAFIQSERYNSSNGYTSLFTDCVNKCFINKRDFNEENYEKVFEISPLNIHNQELETTLRKEIQFSRYQRWAKKMGFNFMGEAEHDYIVKNSDWQNRRDIPRLPNSKKRPLIGITPLTSNVAKNWSANHTIQFNKWQKVINYLHERKCNVITLHHQPLAYKNCLNFGNLSPRELGYAISKLDLLIGCEAGVTHFAGVLKKPMIVLLSASSPLVLRHYNNVRILHGGSCYSCNRFIAMNFDDCECGSVAKNPSSECLNLISSDDVIEEVKDFKGKEFKENYGVEL